MAKILLAEDHAGLLAQASQVLLDSGHEVTSTKSGADVLCLLQVKPPPDLLILDVVMPGLDGLAVLRALGPSAPPVLLMTGGTLDEGSFDPRKVCRVLSKPFEFEEFLESVAECLACTQPSLLDTTEDLNSGKVKMTRLEWLKAVERVKRYHAAQHQPCQ